MTVTPRNTEKATPTMRGVVIDSSRGPVALLRNLAPGDVLTHPNGAQFVVTAHQRVSSAIWAYTTRNLVLPHNRAHLPGNYALFPFDQRAGGNTQISIAPDLYHEPSGLRAIPWPETPSVFTDGDIVRHGRLTWTRRANGEWTNHLRPCQGSSDEGMRFLFTNVDMLRSAIPEHIRRQSGTFPNPTATSPREGD